MTELSLSIQSAARATADLRQSLLPQLHTQPRGLSWCQEHTKCIDQLWVAIIQEARQQFPEMPIISLVATGGYGRTEVAPYSDIDVTLIPAKQNRQLTQAVRWIFRTADEAFREIVGLKLSYVYRLVSDVPGLDPVTLSNLIDARLVAGSPGPLQELESALWSDFPVADFLLAKFAEREKEMASTHRSPLVVEPHLKFGAGSLRDSLTTNFIRLAIGERRLPPTPELDSILTVRNVLHTVTGKLHDHLSRTRREEIANIFGQSATQFGSHFAEILERNHELFRETQERIKEARFPLARGAKSVRGELRLEPDCQAGQAATAVNLATRLGLEIPANEAKVTPQAGPEVLTALYGGEKTIRNLDRSGVLNSLLPELARCRTLMPRDNAHLYTVFEHTVQAIKNLETIPHNTPLFRIHAQIKQQETLLLAILLHDVGKYDPSRDHAVVGAEIAASIADRWRLDPNTTETVTWLITNHLAMSKFVRMRDIMNPDTAREFASITKNEQLLHMLTILTYCDVSAVNNDIWTPVQESLLIELHSRTQSVLQSQTPQTSEANVKRRLIKQIKDDSFSREEFQAFLDSLPPHYLFSTDPESARHHFQMFQKSKEGETIVTIDHRPSMNVSDITITTYDQKGLLEKLLGLLYAHDLTIVGLRASTTETDPPVAIDTFTVSSSGQSMSHYQTAKLQESVQKVLSGETLLDELLRASGKNPDRKQEDLRINIVDQDPPILEFRAPRGRGMAFRLSRVITRLDLNVIAARVGQWASSGSAAFYVLPPPGKNPDFEEWKRAFTAD